MGTIFYQPVDESKIEYVYNAVSRLSEADEVEEVDIDGKLLDKYFYEVEEGVVGEGYLIGTDFTTNEYLDKMVDEAKEEIESGSIQRDYQNANARSIVSMTIGDSWNSVVSQKFTWSLDYDGVHYGDYAEWYNCLIETKSKTLIAGCKNSIIPDDGSVTSIGEYAFDQCGWLGYFTIPKSVTFIEKYAFTYCNFNEIKFSGTVAEWNAIEKDFGWKYGVRTTKVICSDGEVEV